LRRVPFAYDSRDVSPTWLEIAVAIVLLWVAWRIALILTPLVLRRFRLWRRPPEIRILSSTKDKHG
jgi:hypothetical protein